MITPTSVLISAILLMTLLLISGCSLCDPDGIECQYFPYASPYQV